jgi:3-dehydroquinate synthase
MDTKIVTIDLGLRSYDIYVGTGLLYRLAEFIPQDVEDRTVFVVTDENARAYGSQVQNILLDAGAARAEMFVLPPGEKTKSFSRLNQLCEWLLGNDVNRQSIVIAVGGGVVGDITGFAAAVVMRGIHFVQVPTTLMSQVDSSVGGKTGINTPQGKNLVGAFYQPVSVVADIESLKTLPRRELLAGYAEVAKYGLIADPAFFQWLERNGDKVRDLDPESVAYAIEVSVRAKAEIVQADEKETGRRALLNLGHTFGHALETAAKYDGRLLHGEAVAIGMVMAFDLSSRMGICSRDEYERVEQHLAAVGLPTRASMIDPPLKADVSDLLATMKKDKKASWGKMTFVLVNGIGEAFTSQDVPEKLVREVLTDSLGGDEVKVREKGIKGLWKSAFSTR